MTNGKKKKQGINERNQLKITLSLGEQNLIDKIREVRNKEWQMENREERI